MIARNITNQSDKQPDKNNFRFLALTMTRTVYYGIFSFMNNLVAANVLKKHWKKYRYSLEYDLCYRIEMKKIDEIYEDYGIYNSSSQVPDFKDTKLRYRRKSFQKDLLNTKKHIAKIYPDYYRRP